MNHLTRQPDDPGPDHGPLSFRDMIGGCTHIYLGERQIGHIVQSNWLRVSVYKITIHLGTVPRHATASNLDQAKVFARQEVDEFFARTPVRIEARR